MRKSAAALAAAAAASATTWAAAEPVHAAEGVVVAVSGPGDKSSDGKGRGEYVTRTTAELEAAGLSTVVISEPTGLSASNLEVVATRTQAATVIAIDQSDGQIVVAVWARAKPSSPAVFRKSPPEPIATMAPHLFALRTTELVRAAQLEAQGAAAATTDQPRARESRPEPTSAEPHRPIGLFAGASVLASPGVMPITVGPAIEVSWRPHRLWSFGVAAAGPFLSSNRLSWSGSDADNAGPMRGPAFGPAGPRGATPGAGSTGTAGTAGTTGASIAGDSYDVSYDQELFLLVGSFGSTATRARFAPFITAGAGVYRLGARSAGPSERRPTPTALWTPYGALSGEIRWNLSAAVAMRLGLGAGFAWFLFDTNVRGLSSFPAAPLVSMQLGIEVAP